jgi:CheY-like chemotaxis protein
MAEHTLLDGKRVLAVDDEQDVLDTLVDLLPMCEIVTAPSFEAAKELLESQPFDLVILDIMGVDGYGLLEIVKRKNIPAVMLTAHAWSPDNLVRSIKEGAVSYLPKEELTNITDYLRSPGMTVCRFPISKNDGGRPGKITTDNSGKHLKPVLRPNAPHLKKRNRIYLKNN